MRFIRMSKEQFRKLTDSKKAYVVGNNLLMTILAYYGLFSLLRQFFNV